jgi:hypothetical protein
MTKSACLNNLVRLLLQIAITFAVLAATTLLVLRAYPKANGNDLIQDYVSARAWLDGESPYQTLDQLRARIGFEWVPKDVEVRWNPHPPGAVLLTTPYARADFDDALFWLRVVQLLAVAVTWAIAYRLFDPPTPWWLWAALGGLFGLWTPLWQGLDWGQPLGMLALAVVTVWALARADRPAWFGLVLGFACTVRPFVAILVVLAVGWSWRRLLIAGAMTLVGGLLPFLLTGIWPWEWYQRASDAKHFVDGCGALPGLLGIGTGGGVVLFALAACVLAFARFRGLNRDSTAALAAVSAMLTYPLAWFQYDVSLIAVIAWVAAQVGKTGNRLAMFGLVAFLLMRTVPDIIPDPQGTGIVNMLGRNKAWMQVAARGLMLLTVLAAMRENPKTQTPNSKQDEKPAS